MTKDSMHNKFNGAVFFDIDGTLTDIDEGIFCPPQSAADAIEKLKKRGYLTAIATGRAVAYIPDLRIDFDCVISCNGAALTKDGEIVYSNVVPTEIVAEVIEYTRENNVPFVLDTAKNCYYSGAEKEYFNWLSKGFYSLDEYDGDISDISVVKICIQYTDETLDEIKAKFGDKLYTLTHRFNNFMDLGMKGVSKGTGIMAALNIFGIDMADTYAFGDDNNDVEMLSTVAHGVAMTPHAKALDGIAEYVTGKVAEDGIENALKYYNLI